MKLGAETNVSRRRADPGKQAEHGADPDNKPRLSCRDASADAESRADRSHGRQVRPQLHRRQSDRHLLATTVTGDSAGSAAVSCAASRIEFAAASSCSSGICVVSTTTSRTLVSRPIRCGVSGAITRPRSLV
ncbi:MULTISPECIES: hypothetical protein [unclassified Solwaraspora]|uniref:hypothetical protein n=1 Tax=unclassified Solwaraspora TaxID=2627926 RepID=UPI00248AA687|nr:MULTISPECIES: hypothetical protein [unclassified Solwaraspora]WBB99802.1 hypothetical protein O7553_13390 [Solwaraspora sp. WMMA2059]WBC21650.1 hypothetical protein O7543_03980 [Solwaraspora sp. WMMA2080]WJK36289.1 hypothetical protein O7610_08035 [Solwaraspora sp. WMMA2065]